MVRAAGEARAQDTNNLRYEIPNYIPLEYQMESVTPPIARGEKSGRGFSHPATAKLLCPLRYLDRLQADPMYVHISISTGNLSPHLLLASSKMKSKTERSNFAQVTKETGPHFSIPKTCHIMNWS